MLKSRTREGIRWCDYVKASLSSCVEVWQNSQRLAIRCDYSEIQERRLQACSNCRGISLQSLPGKVYAKCLERKYGEIVESKMEDGQCGFRPGGSTTDQIFTLKQIFKKSWEYGKDLLACFVDLEKAYDRVPRDKL